MIRLNDVFRWQDKSWRLIYVQQDRAFVFPMEGKGTGYKEVEHRQLVEAEVKGELKKEADPYEAIRSLDVHTSKKGLINYELFKGLVEDRAKLYDRHERGKYLAELVEQKGLSIQGSYNILRQWWQRGQCPAAFIPSYGKSTGERNGGKKIGRPGGLDNRVPGINQSIRSALDRAYRKYLLKPEGACSIPQAYIKFLGDYQEEHGGIGADQCPSLIQFRYHFNKKYGKGEQRKRQYSKIVYNKDIRALKGSVYDVVQGCGQRYEIDSTPDNVTLVSQTDRTKIVGRPTLYVVSDVYSGMVCGVHVSLENAQLSSATEALFMAISEKKPWLEKIGLKADENLWPVAGLPQEIVSDNAELLSKRIDAFAATYGVSVNHTTPYRADQKGSVERAIGLIQNSIRDILTGVPDEITNKKAGHKEKRLEATLTLSEYQSIVLLAVQEVNRRIRESTPKDYPYKSAPTPVAIWQWSEKTGRCLLSSFLPSDLRRSLLPRVKVSTSKNGIYANGIRYRCIEGADQGVFDRYKNEKSFNDPELAYDTSDITRAWFYPNPSKAPEEEWECVLAPQSMRLEGMSYHEAQEMVEQMRQAKKKAETEKYDFAARIRKEQRRIVERSKEETAEALADCEDLSARARIGAIAQNRKEERILQEKLNRKIDEQDESVGTKQPEKSKPINVGPMGYPSDIDDIPD